MERRFRAAPKFPTPAHLTCDNLSTFKIFNQQAIQHFTPKCLKPSPQNFKLSRLASTLIHSKSVPERRANSAKLNGNSCRTCICV